jgi:peptidoglycan hydrolase FlgJ
MEDVLFQSAALNAQQSQPPRLAITSNPTKANDAAEEFEAFFMTQVMESMFAGIETDGPLGGGFGEGVFRSLLLQEFGKEMAARGGVGISDAVQKEILRIQEGADQ